MEHLSRKTFKNDFFNTFPGDRSGDLTPRQTPGVLYSNALPSPVEKPVLLGWSGELATELGVNNPNQEDVHLLGGNLITPSMAPYAECYAGHQFGNWAGQLGDGRAITLGEWITPQGHTSQFQLKGAGPTAYSRRGDGRAVLRSSIREFLMSEAMHYLGIPTTRALSLVATGDRVLRDMFYDGRPAYEKGAIVLRTAPSFLRFGSFELLASRNDLSNLSHLVNWTIDKYYPHVEGQGDDKILKWFEEVIDRTASMVVHWQRVGFVHGVMNTDNMSILGLTIDYGPFSFLDNYDPSFTPNTTDLPGRRYAFGQQANIAYWNLSCLANAIAPLFKDTSQLEATLKLYEDYYWSRYYNMMGDKLGIDTVHTKDVKLIQNFEEVLTLIQPDMTIFYQLLAEVPSKEMSLAHVSDHFITAFYTEPIPDQLHMLYQLIQDYLKRLDTNKCTREESLLKMEKSNPRLILRNYLLSMAIEEMEKGENGLFKKLQLAIKDPYSANSDEFFQKRPDWATSRAGCSMLSCSS